jgi:hypothetical protein
MNTTQSTPRFLDWFEPHELEPCPACRETHSLTIAAAATSVCFGCGYVRWPGGETTVAALQSAEWKK